MSFLRLKLWESTLLRELRRFRKFQTLTIRGGRVPPGLELKLRNLGALGRPAGRTRSARFHSNGQPSVAITSDSAKVTSTVKSDFEESYID